MAPRGEPFLGAVEAPEARNDPSVLVAVAVPHHDLLTPCAAVVTGSIDCSTRDGVIHEIGEDGRARLEVIDGLEQRYDRKHAHRTVVIDEQAAFLCQQVHNQQIRHASSHGHDQASQAVGSPSVDLSSEHPVAVEHCRGFDTELGTRPGEGAW